MGSNNRFSSFVIVFPLILTAANFGCGGGSASAPPPPQPSVAIIVSLSPPLGHSAGRHNCAVYRRGCERSFKQGSYLGRVLFCTVVR